MQSINYKYLHDLSRNLKEQTDLTKEQFQKYNETLLWTLQSLSLANEGSIHECRMALNCLGNLYMNYTKQMREPIQSNDALLSFTRILLMTDKSFLARPSLEKMSSSLLRALSFLLPLSPKDSLSKDLYDSIILKLHLLLVSSFGQMAECLWDKSHLPVKNCLLPCMDDGELEESDYSDSQESTSLSYRPYLMSCLKCLKSIVRFSPSLFSSHWPLFLQEMYSSTPDRPDLYYILRKYPECPLGSVAADIIHCIFVSNKQFLMMAQKNRKLSYNALSEKIADLLIPAHQILLQILRCKKEKAVESSIIKCFDVFFTNCNYHHLGLEILVEPIHFFISKCQVYDHKEQAKPYMNLLPTVLKLCQKYSIQAVTDVGILDALLVSILKYGTPACELEATGLVSLLCCFLQLAESQFACVVPRWPQILALYSQALSLFHSDMACYRTVVQSLLQLFQLLFSSPQSLAADHSSTLTSAWNLSMDVTCSLLAEFENMDKPLYAQTIELFACIKPECFTHIALPLRSLLKTTLLSAMQDAHENVLLSSFRTLIAISNINDMTEDYLFVFDVTSRLDIEYFGSMSSTVKMSMANAFACYCHAVSQACSQSGTDSEAMCLFHKKYMAMIHQSVLLCHDKERIKVYGLRAIGWLLSILPFDQVLADRNMMHLQKTLKEPIQKNLGQGSFKIRWNAAIAVEQLFRNSSVILFVERSSSTCQSLIESLLDAFVNVKNFKVKIHCTQALAAIALFLATYSGRDSSMELLSSALAIATERLVNEMKMLQAEPCQSQALDTCTGETVSGKTIENVDEDEASLIMHYRTKLISEIEIYMQHAISL